MRNCITGLQGHKPRSELDNYHQSFIEMNKLGDEKSDTEITISEMVKVGQHLVYGDTNGKIHLVKLSSLLIEEEGTGIDSQQPKNSPTIINLQLSAMNLAKTYCSHTSFINQM
jgi:hypothetical protein